MTSDIGENKTKQKKHSGQLFPKLGTVNKHAFLSEVATSGVKNPILVKELLKSDLGS